MLFRSQAGLAPAASATAVPAMTPRNDLREAVSVSGCFGPIVSPASRAAAGRTGYSFKLGGWPDRGKRSSKLSDDGRYTSATGIDP